MKTVFFNNYPIYLVTDLKYNSESNFYTLNNLEIPSIINKMEDGFLQSVYIYDSDPKRLWQYFSDQFNCIEAAGGKVFNQKDQVLFIYRFNKWDLPKGKIEAGESLEEAGVREVEEETGVFNLKVLEQLETTYHIYKHKEKHVLKIAYWFKMTSDFKGEPFPQLDEDITEVLWLGKSEIEKALVNTYENIKLLFK